MGFRATGFSVALLCAGVLLSVPAESLAAGTGLQRPVHFVLSTSPFGDVDAIFPDGFISTIIPQLPRPTALEFDHSGSLYVASNANQLNQSTIRKLLSNGTPSVFATGFTNPVGMAFDAFDNLYVAD